MLSSFARRALACAAAIALFSPPASAGTSPGFDAANLDRSVAPTKDFYRFAVGGWLAKNPVPSDRTSWGAFDEISKRNELRLIDILQSSEITDASAGSERRKIGDLFAACTDVDGVEANGVTALRPFLARVAAIASPSDLTEVVARGSALGSDGGFGFGAEPDPKDARHTIVAVSQGGLSLPTPDYYTSRAARSQAIRDALVREIATTFVLLGDDDARATYAARAVLALETQLAHVTKSPDALRDPIANFHPMPLATLERSAPHLGWPRFFASAGVPAASLARIDVGQPEFVRGFDALATSVPLATWRDYLRWHVVSNQTVALPKAFRDAAFVFNKVFSGQPVRTPRDRSCARLVDREMGFALGNAYVAKYFPPTAKARAIAEIGAIKAALRDDIEHVAWMGPQTRAAALAKLAKLNASKVGYPDRPRSYARLEISRSDLLGDSLAAQRLEFARQIAKIGKPVDRSEWGLTPQTVNAYYDPSMNEIVIPAGILEPPFFSPDADDAINFGGIGAVIGHELTHGFDDEGSQFDGDGNLHAIVTASDSAKFHARVGCIVSQASGFVDTRVGLHLNGKLDAGEAAADVGGTTLAFRALHASIAGKPEPPRIDGFTPDQRFFLSWAQVWRDHTRPQAERAQVLGDPHPVSDYRVNATLSDETPFYAAFGVKPNDPMYRAPGKRCEVW